MVMMGVKLMNAEVGEVVGGRGESGVGESMVTSEQQRNFSRRPGSAGHRGQRGGDEFTEPTVENDGGKELVTVGEEIPPHAAVTGRAGKV